MKKRPKTRGPCTREVSTGTVRGDTVFLVSTGTVRIDTRRGRRSPQRGTDRAQGMQKHTNPPVSLNGGAGGFGGPKVSPKPPAKPPQARAAAVLNPRTTYRAARKRTQSISEATISEEPLWMSRGSVPSDNKLTLPARNDRLTPSRP